MLSKYDRNGYNTTPLTLSIMSRCARVVGVDIHDDTVSDAIYDICCDLESYPSDADFGSSDAYTYIKQTGELFVQMSPTVVAEPSTVQEKYLALFAD